MFIHVTYSTEGHAPIARNRPMARSLPAPHTPMPRAPAAAGSTLASGDSNGSNLRPFQGLSHFPRAHFYTQSRGAAQPPAAAPPSSIAPPLTGNPARCSRRRLRGRPLLEGPTSPPISRRRSRNGPSSARDPPPNAVRPRHPGWISLDPMAYDQMGARSSKQACSLQA